MKSQGFFRRVFSFPRFSFHSREKKELHVSLLLLIEPHFRRVSNFRISLKSSNCQGFDKYRNNKYRFEPKFCRFVRYCTSDAREEARRREKRKKKEKKRKRTEAEHGKRWVVLKTRKHRRRKESWRWGTRGGRADNDDEWLFRSATPPRGCGPEKHPFPSKAGRDRKQRDFAVIYCRGLARCVREATRHLSFQLGGYTVSEPGHAYISYPSRNYRTRGLTIYL